MKVLSIVCAIFIISANADTKYRSYGKITGGEEASIKDFPWQVSITNIFGGSCTGSIINQKSIITAAHCINPNYDIFLRVRVGSSRRDRDGTLKLVKKVIIHPDFDKPALLNNDIALIILRFPLEYNENVQPVALPEQDEEAPEDGTFVVSGWGVYSNISQLNSDDLNAVFVQIVDRDVCADVYTRKSSLVSDNVICAGVLDFEGTDACHGGAGSSLTLPSAKTPVLYGFVSWGLECVDQELPEIHTRVSSYVDWIKNQTKEEELL